jgi:hypothetical protein
LRALSPSPPEGNVGKRAAIDLVIAYGDAPDVIAAMRWPS